MAADAPGAPGWTRRRLLKWAAGGGLALASGALGVEGNCLHVERLQVDRFGFRRRLRLGLLADLHAPRFSFDLDRLKAAINAEGCDLVVSVGDLIEEASSVGLVEGLLSGLEAPLGRFAVLGNWEHWGRVDLRALALAHARAGFELLINARVEVPWEGAVVSIVGLDDMLDGSPRWPLVAERPDDPALILSHCPASAEAIVAHRPDPALILSGHTHGGQIAPLGWAIWTPPGSGDFVRGRYEVGDKATMLVSPGLGNSVIPFRTGSPPTLMIVDVL